MYSTGNRGYTHTNANGSADEERAAIRALIRLGLSVALCAVILGLKSCGTLSSERIDELLNRDTDIETVFSRIGGAITGEESIMSVFHSFSEDEEEDIPEEIQIQTVFSEEMPEENIISASTDVEQVTEKEASDLVELYRESQSGYSALSLPDCATDEMPDLGIVLTAPAQGEISSGFGYREDPITGLVRYHYGIDISLAEGDAVCAAAAGEVLVTGESSEYGNYAELDHGNGITGIYAHLDSIAVEAGQSIEAGQNIGCAGSTGRTTGCNLHFELTKDGVYINPEYYIAPENICGAAE